MAWFSWRAAGTAVASRQFLAVWFVATVAYGAGDVVTTIAVTRFVDRLVEFNPLLRASYHLAGVAGIVVVKLAVFAVCLAISVYGVRSADRLLAYFPPAVLAVVGAFTTVFNLRLLLG